MTCREDTVQSARHRGDGRSRRRRELGRVGGQPGDVHVTRRHVDLRVPDRRHLRDVGDGARRRLHDHGHLQLCPGRDRHVPRVRRLGADGQPRDPAADRGAAHRARDRAAHRHRPRPRDHAPPAGQGAGRAAPRDRRVDVRVHRSREHDLGPEPQPHTSARCSARVACTSPGSCSRGRALFTIVLAIVLGDRPAASCCSRPASACRCARSSTTAGSPASSGARSELVSSFSWALGCSLAALAGILLAPDTGHVDERTAHVVDHHVVRGRRGRPDPQPAPHLPGRDHPGARAAVVAVVPDLQRTLGDRASSRSRPSCSSSSCCCCRRRTCSSPRLNTVRRTERVSTVRDTILGMSCCSS